MSHLKDRITSSLPICNPRSRLILLVLVVMVAMLAVISVSYADVPGGRPTPDNVSVPNPGTQEQELTNITFPAPYNTFEFVVTCGACHGGTIDQQAGHFANWAGSAHANAFRDPIFRANQQIVNQTVLNLTGEDGAGNVCVRCHSPNAWYSGRTDPNLAGMADTSNAINSIVLSTDGEGILCEFCHRTIGGVEMQRADLDPNDPVWNMMAGISDWPHTGAAYPQGPVAGNPYGDATFQINDGMTYGGKYPGTAEIYFSDIPLAGTNYTGQAYGVYPPGWQLPGGIDASGQPAFAPDGSVPLHFEAPIGPPQNPDGSYNYQGQAFSPEHTTFEGDFIRTSEFCGGCHDLTIPVLNHGMPEQRTYTEWRYSSFGDGVGGDDQRCQDCHMPTQKHEYADDIPVSLNADPVLSGWFPYAKDRNPNGGTAFHKFQGSNRELPMMMSILYPEVDLEVIGAVTGNDVRIFPGMLSSRDTMWTRAQRNAEVEMLEAVKLDVLSAPVEVSPGIYEVQVQVTNESGHRIPTGYPDGRRLFVSLTVADANGAPVYVSGYYDEAAAQLYDDPTSLQLDDRALTNVIDATVDNQVMIYEKRTGSLDAGTGNYVMSVNLINTTVLFDNRIPPAGFTYADYSAAGTKFVTYDDPTTKAPREDFGRYPDGQNWDVITYRFAAPSGSALTASATAYWQTHTREFMEHLRTESAALGLNVRPEGPPNLLDPNYPLTPNYLSDNIPDFDIMTSLDGTEGLQDNWGGVAYATWLLTGKGSPYPVGSDSSDLTAVPAAPSWLTAISLNPFAVQLDWEAVPAADGYEVWIRYGASDLTASWDRLAVVYDGTTLVNDAMNIGKTYGFKVVAFNGQGDSADSPLAIITTPIDLPLNPMNTKVVGVTPNSVELSWFDQAELEIGFIIQRQDVPVMGDFYEVARIPSQTPGGATGGNAWTDTGVLPGMTYNYRVAAYNDIGQSTWDIPVTASTGGLPTWVGALGATAISGNRVDLSWSAASGLVTGYRIERNTTGPNGPWTTTFVVANPNATSYSDTTAVPSTTYWYRAFAYNTAGSSAASNSATVTTPAIAPIAPTNLVATVQAGPQVLLTWTDNANNEQGFYVERANGTGPDVVWARIATVNGANITTYTDTTVGTQTTYSYRVQAFAGGGSAVSPYTNVATAVIGTEIPGAPSQLLASRVQKNRVTLDWMDNSTNETYFEIFRSTDGATFAPIGTTGVNISTYNDRSVNANTRYWYYVRACNTAGCSQNSETIDVRTRR